ncbi:MAG TPA: BON domain-containing protein [Symbiobacteriaceae bacterium]|nr:BON domain-containing protein [Symbiobacteriaceae bacterium]
MAEHQTRNPDRDKPFNPPGVQKPYNNDRELQQQVKSALLSGTESAGIDIKVMVEDGVVRLYGVVDVLSHKTIADDIARRVPGVTRIENDITVANEETQSDKELREQITSKFAHRPEYRDMGVRVDKGLVSLVGHAGSYEDVREAARMVEDMAGVKEVKIAKVKVGEGQKEDEADVSRAAVAMLKSMGYDMDQLTVYADAGVLFVKGFVRTKEDRSRIKTAMHKIQGCDKVEALLVTDDEFGGEIH